MNYKTITITLTLTLTFSYVVLVFLYSAAMADGLNPKTESHGRNSAERTTEHSNSYHSDTYSITKEDWQIKLKNAEAMLELLVIQE